MNEKPTPKKPECRRCGAMFCSCSENHAVRDLTEFERKRIEFNKRALYESRKRDLPDLKRFPV
jgi:hypothetical protein